MVADAGGNAIDVVSPSSAASRTSRVFANRLAPEPVRRPGHPDAGRADLGRRGARTTSTTSASSPASRSRPAPRTSTASIRAPARVTVFASGFTNIMDLAFGRDGTLYVLEIDHTACSAGPTARSSPSRATGPSARSRCPPGRSPCPAASPSARMGCTSPTRRSCFLCPLLRSVRLCF